MLPGYTARLVRGGEGYGYYSPAQPARIDLDPLAVAWGARMQEPQRENATSQ